MAELEAPFREAIKSRKLGMLQPRGAGGDGHAGREADGRAEAAGQGLQTSLRVTWEEVAAAVAADPAVHRRREELKRAIDEIERTLPRPPAARDGPGRPQVEGRRRDLRPASRRLPEPRPRVAPRPPGVILASQKGGSFARASIVPAGDKTGRRGALSRWLTRPDNPLTARVIVNRLWHHHFGRGIVASPSDFGVRGEPPSHPELLDWLAVRAGRQRLAAQADPSPDGDLGGLSPVEPGESRSGPPTIPRTRCSPG